MANTLPPHAQLPLLPRWLVSAAAAVRTVLRWLVLCLALAGPVLALGPTIVPDMLRCWMLLGDFAPTLAVSTRTTASAARSAAPPTAARGLRYAKLPSFQVEGAAVNCRGTPIVRARRGARPRRND